MCYFVDNSKININRKEEIENYTSSYVVGITYPTVPIITDESNELILAKWRFNPAIAETPKYRTVGLNIRSEDVENTMLFKEFTDQHCIIPVNGFYEWKHFNNHKIKVKHYITMPDEETFFLAGLWRFYGKGETSFGILTTASNDLMTDIHNNKKRMPISLNRKQAEMFLKSEKIDSVIFPNLNPELVAENLEPEKLSNPNNTLFG
jgi:putative SOS response-associated peptidase YedK